MKTYGDLEIAKKYNLLIEVAVGLIAIALLIYIMRPLLLFGESTLLHDNIIWRYPFIQFFAENIINGHYPYWDPFTHGGEPFYPNSLIAHLLDPLLFITIFLVQFFTKDIVMLFNWFQFIQSLVMAIGVYIVFRQLAEHLFIRLTLIPILLYSSFMLVTLRIGGLSSMFVCAPYIAFFLFSIVYYKDYQWSNWIIMSGLIGLNWQSYRFSGIWVLLLFFLIGTMIFHRDLLKGLFNSKGIALKFTISIIIILGMMMLNIAIMLENDNFVYPARMLDVSYKNGTPLYGPQQYEGELSSVLPSIKMPYGVISQTGTFSSIWDFIQPVSPVGNKYINGSSGKSWGMPSEAYIYIGLLPWALAVLGMVAGKHDFKNVWMLITIGFGLLMLGPAGWLHRILYAIYPPLWFIRHIHLFVLFFLFGLIYFYILGFNHIFSILKSGTSLFSEVPTEGILVRFIKNRKICRYVSFLIFTVCTIVFVYLMTVIERYILLFIVLIFLIGWLLRKDLGKKYLFVGLITSHILIVLILIPNRLEFIYYTAFIMGIPLLLFLFIRAYWEKLGNLKQYALIILFIVFTIGLLLDLTYGFLQSAFLYTGQKHPKLAYNIDTTLHKPHLPQNRLISPPPLYSSTDQAIRYLSLVYRQPFVFSSPNMAVSSNFKEVEKPFNELINGSFESWIMTQDKNFLPQQFSYYQDGLNGSVTQNTLNDKIREGRYSVLLKPSSKGNSFLRYCSPSVEKFKGNYAVASVWAKSVNTIPDAIQMDVQDGTPEIVVNSYKNSGDWERLTAIKFIDENAKQICVTFNVKYTATAEAYLDLLTIGIIDAFEATLKSKRWSSWAMLMNYHKLVYSNIPPAALREMFAIGKPLFQFKKGFVLTEENNIFDFLKGLGHERSVYLLNDYVLVDKANKISLHRLEIPLIDYSKLNQSILSVENSDIKVKSADDNNKFSYTIGDYNFNSFNIKTSAKKQGVLYWADGYDKWWIAYINGAKAPIYQANVNFKAIILPAGENNIKFIYNPFFFRIALFVFCFLFVVSLAVPFIIFVSKRTVFLQTKK